MFRALVFVGALAATPALAAAQQPCTTDARHVVNELYRHMLERPADAASQGMADRLANGRATVRQVVREIAVSPEHHQRFLNSGHEAGVNTLYRHIFGRQPDAGAASHVQVAQSQGFDAVIDRFLASAEYAQNFGDWGVPGSGGVRFCGNTNSANNNTAVAGTSGVAAEMDSRFHGLDRNNDGRITRNEWRGSAQAFRNHDWDGNGILAGDEIRAGAARPDLNDRRVDRDEFRALDANNDGRITANEWDGSRRNFSLQDLNGDGVITRREFDSEIGR